MEGNSNEDHDKSSATSDSDNEELTEDAIFLSTNTNPGDAPQPPASTISLSNSETLTLSTPEIQQPGPSKTTTSSLIPVESGCCKRKLHEEIDPGEGIVTDKCANLGCRDVVHESNLLRCNAPGCHLIVS